MAKQGLFDNVLDGFNKIKENLQIKRTHQRWVLREAAIIDIQGKLFECDIIDASPHVIRINMPVPLSLRERCTIVLKGNPSQQLVGMPIITQQEFRQGYWNRLSLKNSITVMEQDKAS